MKAELERRAIRAREKQEAEEEHLRAERAKRSLAWFCRESWKIIKPSAPLQWSIVNDAMCDHLEAVFSGQIKNLLITIPPGCLKSVTVKVAFPAWCWAKDPSLQFLCAANEGDLATRDSLACRYVLESDWYKRHYPDVKIVSDQNVKTWYQTSQRGHRQAVTVASKATGKKGDILIVDDPHDAKKVEGEADRKAVLSWWKETFFDRVNDFKTGRRIVVGQRTHRGDLQGFIKESGGFEELCIPEQFEPARRTFTSIGWTDPRKQEGELLRPDRFGPEEVRDAQHRLGTIGYNAKHQQRPESKEGYRFKASWLQGRWSILDNWYTCKRPGYTEYRFHERDARLRFGTADGAASEKTSADFTVISSWIVTPRNDLLWIGCRRVQAEIPDQPAIAEAEYAGHRLDWLGIEAVLSNVGLFQHSKRTRMNVKKLDPERQDKLARAAPVLVYLEAGRLFFPGEPMADFPQSVIEAELLAFTGDDKVDEHDDIFDTLAYAVKCINSGMIGGSASMPRAVGGVATLAPSAQSRGASGAAGLKGLKRIG